MGDSNTLLEKTFAKTRRRTLRDDAVIEVKQEIWEWQCSECGAVVKASRRPCGCLNCETFDTNLPGGVNVMLRRAACGWFE